MEVSKLNVGHVYKNYDLKVKGNSSIPYFTSKKNDFDDFINNNGSGNNKFNIIEALKNFGKGVISPLKAMIKHPFISIGMIAATIAACAVAPAFAPVMTLGFGVLSLYEVGKGTYSAIKEYKSGNYDDSEKAFQKIGSGLVGTVLTAMGLKNTARTSLELVEAQKLGRPLKVSEKLEIMDKVKRNGYISALKDNLKILSKDGIKAIGNNLNPSNILANAKQLISGLKTKSALSPEELKRRSNMSTRDITKEAKAILDKTFDEMGIPQEVRPKLIVSDDLRYQTAEDANKVISKIVDEQLYLRSFRYEKGSYNIEVFKPGEDLRTMTNEEILTRIKSVFGSDERTQYMLNDNMKHILNQILNIQKPTKGGCYIPSKNTITLNTGGYRKGLFGSLEEIVSHEALHAKMALYRNSLSAEESQQIVKNLLRERIINGEPEQIFKEGSFLGNITMEAPKMTPKMRQDFLKFADEFIFADGDKTQITQKLSEFLASNPEFIANNGGNSEKAMKVLTGYVTSHTNRYDLFSKSHVKNVKPLNLTPEQHQMAVESLKEFVATVEGNSRTGGLGSILFGPSRKDFHQYEFSPEELLARNTAAEIEQSKLIVMLEDSSLSAVKRSEYLKRLQTLDMQLEYNRIGKEFYDLYTQSLNNPGDTQIATRLSSVEKQLKNLETYKLFNALGFENIPSFPINGLAHL